MHQYIKFLNDIANNHHHYFLIIHHHSIQSSTLNDHVIVLLFIGMAIGLIIFSVFNQTENLVMKSIGLIILNGCLILFIFLVGGSFVDNMTNNSETTSIKTNISQAQINHCVSIAHTEYPYLVTVKQDKFLHHSTTNYLASSVKGGVVHNAIKIHDASASDTIQPKYVIKHYIEPTDGAAQISYTDSRAYLKHKVKQNIDFEKDNLSN